MSGSNLPKIRGRSQLPFTCIVGFGIATVVTCALFLFFRDNSDGSGAEDVADRSSGVDTQSAANRQPEPVPPRNRQFDSVERCNTCRRLKRLSKGGPPGDFIRTIMAQEQHLARSKEHLVNTVSLLSSAGNPERRSLVLALLVPWRDNEFVRSEAEGYAETGLCAIEFPEFMSSVLWFTSRIRARHLLLEDRHEMVFRWSDRVSWMFGTSGYTDELVALRQGISIYYEPGLSSSGDGSGTTMSSAGILRSFEVEGHHREDLVMSTSEIDLLIRLKRRLVSKVPDFWFSMARNVPCESRIRETLLELLLESSRDLRDWHDEMLGIMSLGSIPTAEEIDSLAAYCWTTSSMDCAIMAVRLIGDSSTCHAQVALRDISTGHPDDKVRATAIEELRKQCD